jgi:hypothetical protein
MKNLKQNLQGVAKELKVLTKNVENLIKSIAKIKNPNPKAVKTKPYRKTVSKRFAKPTDTDKVLNIIKKSKKGVDTAILKKKTGFNDKKIWNIIYRTFKAGKIKRADKGIYIAA